MNYYENELKKLVESEYPITLKLWDGLGNSTKCMDLNKESIPILIDWLTRMG